MVVSRGHVGTGSHSSSIKMTLLVCGRKPRSFLKPWGGICVDPSPSSSTFIPHLPKNSGACLWVSWRNQEDSLDLR